MLGKLFPSWSEPKEENVNENNWVRLRFWLPSYAIGPAVPAPEEVSAKATEVSLAKKEVKNVGHVSLETQNIYASIWPDGEDTTEISVASQHKIYYMPSAASDEEAEGRPADFVIDLYSLNVPAIEQKFAEIKEKTNRWQLLGRNRMVGHDGQSCAGQTWELIEAGGLTEKVSIFNTFKQRYLYATPPNILHITCLYKEWEILRYPHVVNFDLDRHLAHEGSVSTNSSTPSSPSI